MDLKYTIQQGDTLSEIADNLGLDMAELAEANGIEDVNKIYAGKKLTVPFRQKQEEEKVKAVERSIQLQEEPAPPQRREPIQGPKQPEAVEKGLVDRALDFFMPEDKVDKKPSLLSEPKPKADKKEKEQVVEDTSEPFLPSNVRQFLYDLSGGTDSFTEKDLKSKERAALINVVRTAKKRKSSVIEYEDYETTDRGNQYADVGGGGSSILSKVSDPAYSLKTLIGQAQITKDEQGNTLIVDQYNFNNAAKEFDLFGFSKGVAKSGFSLYKQARNIGKYFGSGEGEGTPVVINLGKINV
jgi:LysM repeat protein